MHAAQAACASAAHLHFAKAQAGAQVRHQVPLAGLHAGVEQLRGHGLHRRRRLLPALRCCQLGLRAMW